jgi:hypothetical protein
MSFGQIKKQFSVEDDPSCDNIKLTLKANSGTCFIKPSHNPENSERFQQSVRTTLFSSVCKGSQWQSLSNNIIAGRSPIQKASAKPVSSRKVFGSEKPEQEKFWKMYLTDAKPYSLELNYGVGNANVDLSGLAIKS